MAVSRVLFIGDSSLYCQREVGSVGKRNKNKRKFIDAILEERHIPGLQITQHAYCSEGVKAFLRSQQLQSYDSIACSYFGNDCVTRWTAHKQNEMFQNWQEFLKRLRGKKVVFWVGGFSLKYDLQPHYDTQMDLVRSWIREAGFQVVTAFDKVAAWKMGNMEHVHWDTAEELADFWLDLLSGNPLPPSYLCQTLPTTALVYGKGWRSANGQVAAPPPPAVQVAAPPPPPVQVKHYHLSDDEASLADEVGDDLFFNSPACTTWPKKRWLRAAESALPDQMPMKRWFRPKKEPLDRWDRRHKLEEPIELPVSTIKRWHRQRPETDNARVPEIPEGLTIEECWHKSNREGKMLYIRGSPNSLDAEKDRLWTFFAAFGEVLQIYVHPCQTGETWGWIEMSSRAESVAVLHAVGTV